MNIFRQVVFTVFLISFLPNQALAQEEGEVHYQDILFSVDVAEISRREQEYMKMIYPIEEIHQPHAIDNAIRRYEELWIPLRIKYKDPKLVPPMDVEWVWHTHMLRPAVYIEDSLKISGGKGIVDHEHNVNNAVRALYEGLTRQIWKKLYPTEPYDYDQSLINPVSDYKQISTYNITAACVRQRRFARRMTVEHAPRRMARLIDGETQYRKYLELASKTSGGGVVPSLGVDLAWHSHIVHPRAYYTDMIANLGQFIDHDDNPTDSEAGADMTLDEINKVFGEEEGATWYNLGTLDMIPVLTQTLVRNALSKMEL